MSNIKLLYGIEFWHFLENAVKNSRRHVFIFSAFARQEDIDSLTSLIRAETPYLIIIRDDISGMRVNQENIIYAPAGKFHAKLYIIDDTIIIGSQNIYKVVKMPLAEKTGELSVAFITKDAVNIIYQSLMIILKAEYENYFSEKHIEYSNNYTELYDEPYPERLFWLDLFKEYKLESFLDIGSEQCPSCGSYMNLKENEYPIIYCEQYNEKISSAECGEGNACKYCYDGGYYLVEPQIIYTCRQCGFSVGYNIEELNKSPYYSWHVLSFFKQTNELQQFLKLYFYLIHNIGEYSANKLLKSLNILGNLSNLDLDKRYYELDGFYSR